MPGPALSSFPAPPFGKGEASAVGPGSGIGLRAASSRPGRPKVTASVLYDSHFRKSERIIASGVGTAAFDRGFRNRADHADIADDVEEEPETFESMELTAAGAASLAATRPNVVDGLTSRAHAPMPGNEMACLTHIAARRKAPPKSGMPLAASTGNSRSSVRRVSLGRNLELRRWPRTNTGSGTCPVRLHASEPVRSTRSMPISERSASAVVEMRMSGRDAAPGSIRSGSERYGFQIIPGMRADDRIGCRGA